MRKQQTGFSLIELLIVVAIILIIAAIAFGAGAPAPNTDYVVFSTGVSPAAGGKGYCATQDGVVRFQSTATPPTAAFTTKRGLSGPCAPLNLA